jgi:hypothetical protein
MASDLYTVLGLTREADQATITASYRKLLFEFHPDHNSSPQAAAKTAEITGAYKVLGDPVQRARYDATLGAPPKSLQSVPRAVLGTSKLTLYDFLERPKRPRHRHVRWQDGIWSAISNHFSDCKARGCLVLLRIDPTTNQQIYQHGDPGPTIRITPDKGEFKLLQPWIAQCHELEDYPPS